MKVLATLVLTMALAGAASAQTSLEDLVSSVVRIKTFINPDGRTIENLGREREGSGIVIDEDGLVLTIGYLMVEAHAAEVVTNGGRTVPANIVGYDHETGFGLLKAIEPLKFKPLPFGKSADLKERDPVLVASAGGANMVGAAYVVAKREFAGNWEYLLDEAIFTAPPHPAWSGAALISRDGKLVGVGSLIVGDAAGGSDATPGNMFVPIDRLPPILADLIADGRAGELAASLARRHHGRDARPAGGEQGDAGRPGREGRRAARRHHRRRRGRAGQDDGRVLPQGLGARQRRRQRAGRRAAGQRGQAHRRDVDEPARSPEAEVDLLTRGRRAAT